MQKSKQATRMLAVLAALLFTGAAQAVPLLGVTITDSTSSFSSAYKNWTLGYRFNALADTNVVSLGAWDDLGDGLSAAHDVGLWDNSGVLLASASVASGTTAILDGGYRWTDLTSGVALTSGLTYTVAAYYGNANNDLVADLVASASIDSRINVQGSVQLSGGSLAFATSTAHPYTGGAFSYGGGNIRLANTVSEPASVALLSLALIGAGFARVRRSV